jgi:TonB-linked SusC/RagA family outer membrane protein
MIHYLQTARTVGKTLKKILLSSIFLIAVVSTALAQSQEVTVKGKVISGENNKAEAVPQANVLIKGTQTGTTTDNDGNYSLQVPDNATLVFSSISFVSQEVAVNSRSLINITLQPDTKQLGELVVVGYFTQDRKNLIGSVSKVDPTETKSIPTGSFDAQIQGKVSGVQISSNTGVPGESVNIRVRGATSINADNDPLYVIDGVFINNSSLQTISTGGKATSPIADINPADIESVSVLKDAEATALYGSRGANGVIIVTTKRGKYEQKPTISLNLSQGWSKAAKLWDLTTGPEHAQLVNEWWVNTGKDDASLKRTFENRPFRPVSEVINGTPGRGLPEEQQTYDRLSELFRTAQVQSYGLSLSGGTQSTKYYISGGYDRQEAIIKPIYFERAGFKINLDQKVNNKILVGVSNSFTRTYRNQARAGDGPQGGLLQAALHTPTYLSPYNEKGELVGRAGFDNLTLLLNNYDVNSTSTRYIGNLYAEAELLPDLKFRTSWGIDYNNYDESEYWNTYLLLGSPNGYATSSIRQFSSWLNEQTLTYRKNLGDHSFGILLGNTLQSDVTTRTYAEGRGFPNNAFTQISSASTTSGVQSGGTTPNWTKSTLTSFFSRLDYSYANKYLFDVSFRADGSSRFGLANPWGYFPTVGAAWRIKEENFLKDVAVVSDLKLKASYGFTGNQNGIGDFAARGLWSGNNPYGGSAGTAPQQLANPNLRWERTRQTSLGLNASFFNNRLAIELDAYEKYTTDGLLLVSRPATTGFSSYWSNEAEISNRGFELGISTVNIQNSDLTWKTSFNVAQNVNKIEKLANPLRYGSRDLILQQQGSPLYSFWVYKQQYVDPQTGNAVYEDVNQDGKITTDDRQIYGSIWPKFFGGLTNSLTYKGFDLNFFFVFQYGNKVYNHNRFFGEGGGARDAARVILASNLNRWQKPGDVTDIPRIDGINVNNYRDGGSRWLEDGSFLRLRSLTLGYTVHTKKVSALRLYVTGSNLLLVTKYTGLDPESSASSAQNEQGIDLGTPPQPRSFQLGVNVTL